MIQSKVKTPVGTRVVFVADVYDFDDNGQRKLIVTAGETGVVTEMADGMSDWPTVTLDGPDSRIVVADMENPNETRVRT